MKKFLLNVLRLVFFSFFLTACSKDLISVHTDYLSHENLASYHVGTPDPAINDPPIGQRLIVAWSLPKCYMEYADLHLEITMRFRNKEQVMQRVDLLKRSGIYTYPMVNEEYFDKGGILTYKVDLFGGGEILDEWRHQLWVDLILFDKSS